MLYSVKMDKIEELLTRGVANIIPGKKELEKVLRSKKKLNVYLGIDPTATRIHLGHSVVLRKLEAFVQLGHNVTFLIGDFTALIGDASDKDKERPILTPEEIRKNFQTYRQQAQKILDFSKVKIKYNSEWLKKLDYIKIIKLCQMFSLNDFISRELIRKRLDQAKKIGLHEVLYPVMQGYDSYFMNTDIQLGGADQTFNMQAGRTLQKIIRNKESFIITNMYLEGTDGRKMSKSWGNAIWLDENPNDMFAKVMAIKDDLILEYYTLATNVSLSEIAKVKSKLNTSGNPLNIKKDLAEIIVRDLWDSRKAKQAKTTFEKVVQEKEMPKAIPVFKYSGDKQTNIVDLLTKLNLAKSRSLAKQLIEQRGITINKLLITNHDSQVDVKNDMIIRVGKRKFTRIEIRNVRRSKR